MVLSHLPFWAALVGACLDLGCQSELELLKPSCQCCTIPSHPVLSRPVQSHGTPPHPAVLTQSRGGSVWGGSSGGWAGSRAVAASHTHSRGLASLLQSRQWPTLPPDQHH